MKFHRRVSHAVLHGRPGSRRRYVDLIDLAAPSQVKSFKFQVAAEIFHSGRCRILG